MFHTFFSSQNNFLSLSAVEEKKDRQMKKKRQIEGKVTKGLKNTVPILAPAVPGVPSSPNTSCVLLLFWPLVGADLDVVVDLVVVLLSDEHQCVHQESKFF